MDSLRYEGLAAYEAALMLDPGTPPPPAMVSAMASAPESL
jgi:hypothetical protein